MYKHIIAFIGQIEGEGHPSLVLLDSRTQEILLKEDRMYSFCWGTDGNYIYKGKYSSVWEALCRG